jgi:hypothetical protein
VNLTTILLKHATLLTGKEGYLKLHEDKTKRVMDLLQLENIYSSKTNILNIQNLEHKYKATKAKLSRKAVGT